MSKLKMPEPSTKNGRRSEKNVSKAERFTTAGSASTWPKSGLTVPVSVRPGRSAYFKSTPTDPFGSVVLVNGLPDSAGCVFTSPRTYGTISSRFGERSSRSPVSSPNDDTYPFALFASSGQVVVSFNRPILRTMANPKVDVSEGRYRSCEKGMRNSARQPRSPRETATSHTASHP